MTLVDQHSPSSDAAMVRTEVSDRLTAIGRLGEHVAAGRLSPAEAVDTSQDLLHMARTWCL